MSPVIRQVSYNWRPNAVVAASATSLLQFVLTEHIAIRTNNFLEQLQMVMLIAHLYTATSRKTRQSRSRSNTMPGLGRERF